MCALLGKIHNNKELFEKTVKTTKFLVQKWSLKTVCFIFIGKVIVCQDKGKEREREKKRQKERKRKKEKKRG